MKIIWSLNRFAWYPRPTAASTTMPTTRPADAPASRNAHASAPSTPTWRAASRNSSHPKTVIDETTMTRGAAARQKRTFSSRNTARGAAPYSVNSNRPSIASPASHVANHANITAAATHANRPAGLGATTSNTVGATGSASTASTNTQIDSAVNPPERTSTAAAMTACPRAPSPYARARRCRIIPECRIRATCRGAG